MRNNFDLNYEEWNDNLTTEGAHLRYTHICIPSQETHFYEIAECNTIGLDLPTWSNVINGNSTIMFVAQDPLRDKNQYGNCNEIVISSPFGVHDAIHRNGRHGEVYYNIFSKIIEKGYGVYLTDIRKFYAEGSESKYFTKKNLERYNQILQDEIDIVKPILIVAFGKDAKKSLVKIDHKKEVLPLIHPSGAARGHIKERYDLDDCSNEIIAEAYINDILDRLSNIK
jgi:uracil-DNA glycosylase